MKKLTKVFGLLAMASMLFFACKPATDEDTKTDNTEQNGGGQGAGGSQSTGGGQGTGTETGGGSESGSGSGTTTPVEETRKLLTSETNLNVKISDIKEMDDYENAKLVFVIGNKVEKSEKAEYGSGYPATQTEGWGNFTELKTLTGFSTPAVGKTVAYVYKVSDVLAAAPEGAYYLGANAYNDSSLISISIAWDIPDDVSVDLTGFEGYDATAGGIVKDYKADNDFKQYGTAFDISFADLGINGHNKIEIIGQTIVDGENKLTEWGNNIGAAVYKDGDRANETSGYNFGTAGHYLIWDNKAHADYDTLHIQSNATACDQLIVTAINLSYTEEGTCETAPTPESD